MNVFLWILAVAVAGTFVSAGAMKLVMPKKKLVESGQGWAADVPDSRVKGIGLAEVLGALGVILPAVTGIATFLVPVAALGLTAIMVGAVATHAKRGETKNIIANVVIGVLALVLAIGRFASPA